ncbi:MAG: FG-GAP repeat protein, partial [Planctomycetes bacterium]|nr:FG-GAP repeat protein [Planctomycetota bacterium]
MGFIVSFTSLVVAPLFGQCLPTKLVPQDAAPGDRFGTSVAADGTFAIIGAPGTVKNGASIGAAYVFHVDDGSWFEQAKLVPDGAGPSAMFGQSVAMSAGVAVVGAPGDTHDGAATGAVYVFRLE